MEGEIALTCEQVPGTGFQETKGKWREMMKDSTDKSIAHTNHVLYFITHNVLIHLLEQTSMTYLISINVSWEILV